MIEGIILLKTSELRIDVGVEEDYSCLVGRWLDESFGLFFAFVRCDDLTHGLLRFFFIIVLTPLLVLFLLLLLALFIVLLFFFVFTLLLFFLFGNFFERLGVIVADAP